MTYFDQRHQRVDKQYNADHIVINHATLDPKKASQEKQNRNRMLRRVWNFWIVGVLERSLHNTVLIALGMHEQPDALANPWRLIMQELDQSPHVLPSDTPITRVYDDSEGALLILGAPGAGKTTLLLKLARDLLERAMQDDTHPIPVVFNLSSWATRQQPLKKWLVDELNTKYQVPRRLGKEWVDADLILPLLDGLDEVTSLTSRAACISAINAYLREHSMSPIVICSRSADYFNQVERLYLRKAVTVEQLSWQQIDEYLINAGEQVKFLREALQKDSDLREMAATPLVLNILILTYCDKPPEALSPLIATSSEARRQLVFGTYVQRMLQRRAAQTRYTQPQIRRWLAYLAEQMMQHGQTEFHLEQLQLDWLLKRDEHSLLTNAAIRVFNGLIAGLTGGLIYGLTLGPLSILINGFYGNDLGWTLDSIKSSVVLTVFILAIAVLISPGIRPVEAITWSRRNILKKLPIALAFGGIFGCLVGGFVSFILEPDGLSSFVFEQQPRDNGVVGQTALWLGLAFGLLISGLMSGLSRKVLSHHHITPSQGIWRSVRYSLLFLLIGWLLAELVALCITLLLLPIYLTYYPEYSTDILFRILMAVAFDGLIVGSILCLFNGGMVWIKHFCLRLLLWITKKVPWNYKRFLDYATERIFLYKVGGGYIFVHRLLMEYFTSLNTSDFNSRH